MNIATARKEEKLIVTHYGLHWTEDDIGYLHQRGNGANFLGLRAPSPFYVQAARSRPANHMFSIGAPVPDRHHWEQIQKLGQDELFRAFMPTPKQPGESGCFFIEDPDDQLLTTLLALSRMSSPIQSIVRPIWSFDPKGLMEELTLTNVQPLVLTSVKRSSQYLVDRAIEASVYSPRRIIISGDADTVVMKPAQRIKNTIFRDRDESDLITLPLESLGVTLLRRAARHEDLLSDLPVRKHEPKQSNTRTSHAPSSTLGSLPDAPEVSESE